MSTQYSNISAKRISILLAQNEKLFHLKDLANLWEITDENTLRTTLKRYNQSGLLFRLYKGFYSVIPPGKLEPLNLGAKALHGYNFLTTESILFREGFISRKINSQTFVGEKSKHFSIGGNSYICRRLQPKYLYNPEGVEKKGGFLEANIYRAIADMLYFNPKFHFDKNVDWLKVKNLQKKIGYPLTPKRYVTAKSK